ncbi:MAG: MFS transporter [Planctomycetota bacterium]|nr:MAG: MFS transporter [Planctomycetota bacterium]
MSEPNAPPPLSPTAKYLILFVAFFGWFFAGVHMSITSLVMRVAAADLLPAGASEGAIGEWFGWYVCAFLFGAAAGGYLFGLIGDRIGRSRAMATSICCYSIFSGLSYFAGDTWQLLALRFLTCMGIGGMWPTGIALLSEAWSGVARPILAGIMGTAANIGILCFASLTLFWFVTPGDWRWTMLVGACPILLGLISFAFVPESPRWLAAQKSDSSDEAVLAANKVGLGEIFRPPILKTTLFGILLGTIPLFGGWGVSNWAAAWSSEAGDTANASSDKTLETDSGEDEQPDETPDPTLKSKFVISRSLPGSISSLLGGALAFYLGRKRMYFLLCVCAFVSAQMLFRLDNPRSDGFLFWTGALGFFSGFFFGWLPLCLPELFPTRVRSTGAGVSFNWGRIVTGIGVLASAAALREAFAGQYATVGQVTGFIYAVGMVAIVLAPPMSARQLDE